MTFDKQANALPPALQARLEAAGMRRTLLTRAVLGLFLTQTQADLSHSQVTGLLQTRGWSTDRVTLYRLLDRLSACGVLLRRSDPDARVWRYRLARFTDARKDPVLACDECHGLFPLPISDPTWVPALQGLFGQLHKMGHRDLSIHGTCPACADMGGVSGAEASS